MVVDIQCPIYERPYIGHIHVKWNTEVPNEWGRGVMNGDVVIFGENREMGGSIMNEWGGIYKKILFWFTKLIITRSKIDHFRPVFWQKNLGFLPK